MDLFFSLALSRSALFLSSLCSPSLSLSLSLLCVFIFQVCLYECERWYNLAKRAKFWNDLLVLHYKVIISMTLLPSPRFFFLFQSREARLESFIREAKKILASFYCSS